MAALFALTVVLTSMLVVAVVVVLTLAMLLVMTPFVVVDVLADVDVDGSSFIAAVADDCVDVDANCVVVGAFTVVSSAGPVELVCPVVVDDPGARTVSEGIVGIAVVRVVNVDVDVGVVGGGLGVGDGGNKVGNSVFLVVGAVVERSDIGAHLHSPAMHIATLSAAHVMFESHSVPLPSACCLQVNVKMSHFHSKHAIVGLHVAGLVQNCVCAAQHKASMNDIVCCQKYNVFNADAVC